jgi:hypothetical protein
MSNRAKAARFMRIAAVAASALASCFSVSVSKYTFLAVFLYDHNAFVADKGKKYQ